MKTTKVKTTFDELLSKYDGKICKLSVSDNMGIPSSYLIFKFCKLSRFVFNNPAIKMLESGQAVLEEANLIDEALKEFENTKADAILIKYSEVDVFKSLLTGTTPDPDEINTINYAWCIEKGMIDEDGNDLQTENQ